VGGFSLPDNRPVSRLSLAELRSQFAIRDPLCADDLSRLADCLPLVRRGYNEQLQRAKIQFVDPRLKLQSGRSLLAAARETVAVSQLIYRALESPRDSAADPVRAGVLQEALAWNECRIEAIARQLDLLDAIERHSDWLRSLLIQLESRSRVSASDWVRLARDIAIAGSNQPLLLPLPAFNLEEYLAEVGHARHARVVARGIEAARIVARLFKCRAARGIDPELVTIAALAQDCGLLLSQARPATRGALTASALGERHASIGAALVAGLVELATQLPALVAQHHLRLNDAGTAPGSVARVQSRGSRLLAVVTRWLELADEARPTTSAEPLLDGGLCFAQAAARLAREALRGDWDRRIAGNLLVALGFARESEILEHPDAARPTADSRNDVRRRIDSAENRWPHAKLESDRAEIAQIDPHKRPQEKQHAWRSAD
jgi:hypothetical protein